MPTRTGIRISALQTDLDELTRVDISSTTTTATISTEGTKDLILNTNEGTNSGTITIQDGTSGDILIEPQVDAVVSKDTGDTILRVKAGSASDTDGAAQVTFSDWQRTASIGLMSTDLIIAKDSSIDPLSDNRRVTINVDSGNVGIGHKFGQHRQPDGSASASVLNVENTTTSGSAQGGNLRLGSNDGAVMGSGHRLGVVEFAGSEAASPGPAGSAMAVGARIEAVTDGTWSTTENGANLDFYTTDGDAVQTKRMTVLADGNVGIGPTAPTKNLHVSKASGEATFRLQSAGYYSDIIQTGANLFIQNAAGGGNTIFYDDAAERMRIDTDGNVGIGDNAPGTLLQVKGTAPYVTLKNSTAENTAGGCESKIIFEDHADVTLAQVEGSHSGSSDDTKGKLILSTHTGSALTAALTIDDGQDATFSGDVVVTGELDVSGGALAFGNGQNAELDVDAVSGTNTAGKSLTISGGQSTGSGAGGDVIFKASNQGSSGSSANALTTVAVMKAPDDDSFVNFLEFMGSPDGQGCGVEVSDDSSSSNVDLNLNSKGSSSYVRIESKEISNFTDAVAKGAGVGNAATVDVNIAHHNCEIVTTICVDIQGLVSTGTIKRVLSDSGETTAAYLTQLTAAKNGIIYKAEMACVEQPAVASGTLVADIDLVTSDVATLGGGEDYDSGGDDIVLVTSGGDWDTGRCVYSASAADLDPEDFYLYLACGNATSANTAAYSAGKFIIKLYGASF